MRSLIRKTGRRPEKRVSVGRYVPFILCACAAALAAFYAQRVPSLWFVLVGAGALTVLGLYDLLQRSHAVRRNYPIVGNFRRLFELVRPQVRQYLIESDNEQTPFSRSQRSLVYARSKNE